MEGNGAARAERLAAAGILALAVLAHFPALGCGWVWDDASNVTRCAPVLSRRGDPRRPGLRPRRRGEV